MFAPLFTRRLNRRLASRQDDGRRFLSLSPSLMYTSIKFSRELRRKGDGSVAQHLTMHTARSIKRVKLFMSSGRCKFVLEAVHVRAYVGFEGCEGLWA